MDTKNRLDSPILENHYIYDMMNREWAIARECDKQEDVDVQHWNKLFGEQIVAAVEYTVIGDKILQGLEVLDGWSEWQDGKEYRGELFYECMTLAEEELVKWLDKFYKNEAEDVADIHDEKQVNSFMDNASEDINESLSIRIGQLYAYYLVQHFEETK